MTVLQATCPLCPETFESPDPGLDDGQQRLAIETYLDWHLSTHPPSDWLPALLDARRDLAAAQDRLAALSLTDYEVHALDERRGGG